MSPRELEARERLDELNAELAELRASIAAKEAPLLDELKKLTKQVQGHIASRASVDRKARLNAEHERVLLHIVRSHYARDAKAPSTRQIFEAYKLETMSVRKVETQRSILYHLEALERAGLIIGARISYGRGGSWNKWAPREAILRGKGMLGATV